MRDHGGNLDAARAVYGAGEWIDLSTGINRVPYPLPPIPAEAWTALPDRGALAALIGAAQAAYATPATVLPVAGAQAAIKMIPRAFPAGLARVLAPTYNEHAASLREAGWRVEEVDNLSALAGADLAVVVNPNNPDGACHLPGDLRQLAGQVGRLVVDESFADPVPELSLASDPGRALILRSFGKFYGLAGLRLGFVLGKEPGIAPLAAMAGPWPVSGPAIVVGRAALADRDWAAQSIARLADDAARLDGLAVKAGWRLVGGGHLFRLYETPAAAGAQQNLALHHIWSRIFPWHPCWLRLGLPAPDEWGRVEAALG